MRQYNVTTVNILSISASDTLVPFIEQEKLLIGDAPNSLDWIKNNLDEIVRMYGDTYNLLSLLSSLWGECAISARIFRVNKQTDEYEDAKAKAEYIYREYQTVATLHQTLNRYITLSRDERDMGWVPIEQS